MKLKVTHPDIDEYLKRFFLDKRIAAIKVAVERDEEQYLERLEILLKKMVGETIDHVLEDENYEEILKHKE